MPVVLPTAPVAVFFGPNPMVEGRARDQLDEVARLPGALQVAGFPDLHPGRYGPVGMAALFDRLHPLLIGGDVGCGIGCFRLSAPARKIVVDKAVRAWSVLSDPFDGAVDWARDAGLAMADARVLGTIGGGNHFCELARVASAPDGAPLSRGDAVVLVHSGSRGLGEAALARLPQVGQGVDGDGLVGRAWLDDHDHAVRFARENRAAIAARAASALRLDWDVVVDAVHNAVVRTDAGWLHRKGAADATGPWVPVAGSRDTPSWLIAPSAGADARALGSFPHGAGRRFDRSACHGRFTAPRRDGDGSVRLTGGGRVVCGDRDLLVEESSGAYKDSERVAAAVAAEGLGSDVVRLEPMLTFKSGVRA